MANIAQNITEISKIIGCSEDFYKSQCQIPHQDPYFESTMYLVNKGTYINSQREYTRWADYPQVDLPDFTSIISRGLELQFILYSNYDKKFYLYIGNSPYSTPTQKAHAKAQKVYTTFEGDGGNAVYTYQVGDDHWENPVPWNSYTWTTSRNICHYSVSQPFKIVWVNKDIIFDYEGSNITFCTEKTDEDVKNNVYFARFYSTDGTYLHNDTSVAEDLAYTDLYYGARKLSDTLIVNNYPDSPNYPNDKIYLQPRKNSGGNVYGFRVYFKHDDFVIPLATTDQLILVEESESDTSILQMTMTVNDQTVIKNIPTVDENGNLPSNIYNALYEQLHQEFESELSKTLTWQKISTPATRSLQGRAAGGGTGDYEDLENLPSVNNNTLIGNKTTDDLGIGIEVTKI